MWWAGSKFAGRDVLDVYVGTRAVAVSRGQDRLLAEPVVSSEQGFECLERWLVKSPARQRLKVWLSGGLCRAFHMPAVPGANGRDELLRIARSLVPSQTGFQDACNVWLSKGNPTASHICVAVQAQTVDHVLHTALSNGKHRAVSIKPWWAEVMKSVTLQNPLATVAISHDCDSLTVIKSGDTSWALATTLSPVWDRKSADAALARLMLSEDIPLEKHSVLRLLVQSNDGPSARAAMALAPFVQAPL